MENLQSKIGEKNLNIKTLKIFERKTGEKNLKYKNSSRKKIINCFSFQSKLIFKIMFFFHLLPKSLTKKQKTSKTNFLILISTNNYKFLFKF